ncbi:hypothetical protein SKAU_G00210850 [Synaphobranchus kaupii]|uniref:Uncharacterized protein n=1 Tax=Synaphobranchus kaupii TaxID=118154 RepID=A0A9Q1F9B3_SYNKA|nr:hypothetical protein SKAU_G00210850 [Synaphobranchus kaupii]
MVQGPSQSLSSLGNWPFHHPGLNTQTSSPDWYKQLWQRVSQFNFCLELALAKCSRASCFLPSISAAGVQPVGSCTAEQYARSTNGVPVTLVAGGNGPRMSIATLSISALLQDGCRNALDWPAGPFLAVQVSHRQQWLSTSLLHWPQ